MSQHTDAQHPAHLSKEADAYDIEELGLPPDTQPAVPTICGLPLKYVSLVTLAVQNALLTLIMHYSRVSAAPSRTYSAAAAVLMTELLKGFISLLVAFSRLDGCPSNSPNSSLWNPRVFLYRIRRLGKEVFRPDCWKLSIPAILYVIQNNLQFVAVSNLEAATFQVSYQMKILTTAAFSVVLLRKKLSPTKWVALLFLAIGVGIVQIQTGSSASPSSSSAPSHDMNAFKGFMAVVAACFTSGLAGVYFEMVLKNSQADLWVRNVQLSLFSLLPALLPVIFAQSSSGSSPAWFSRELFANFGVWAWATVAIQVLGGLLTALVIKYADNILKGFATSLSIVISFLASVALFNFHMTLTFILGSTVVLVATWMYNQPDTGSASDGSFRPWNWRWRRTVPNSRASSALEFAPGGLSRRCSTSSLSSLVSFSSSVASYPGSPVEREAPFLAQLSEKRRQSQCQCHQGSEERTHSLGFGALRNSLLRLLQSFGRVHPASALTLPLSMPLAGSTSSSTLVFAAPDHTYTFPAAPSVEQVPLPFQYTNVSRPSSSLSLSSFSPISRPTSAMGGASAIPASVSAPEFGHS